MMRVFRCAVLLAAVVCASVAQAAVVFTTANETGNGVTPFTPSFTPLNNDLINGLSPSASAGDFTLEGSGGLPILTDGTFANILVGSNPPHPPLATAGDGGGSGTSVTYTLTPNALGYDLSNIVIYGGWNDNGRDQQNYTVQYSTVFAPGTFITLGSANFNPAIAGSIQSAIRINFFEDDLPWLAINVAAVRVNFNAVENGYTGYGEIDVVGVASVPEPSTFVLAALGGLGLLIARRRRK